MKKRIYSRVLTGTVLALVSAAVLLVSGCTQTVSPESGAGKPLTGSVYISGTVQVGKTLSANIGNLGGSGTVSYQWLRDDEPIDGATNKKYPLVKDDANAFIGVNVSRKGYSGILSDRTGDVVAIGVGDPDDPDGVGGEDSGSTPGGVAGVLRFNLTGATAIYAAEAVDEIRGSFRGVQARSARNARTVTYTDDDVLFKVLGDGSVAPIIDVSEPSSVPDVVFIAHSPVAGEKDIYIGFEADLRGEDSQGNALGHFLHVKEDGSVITILQSYHNMWPQELKDMVVFDAQGNIYFRANSGETNGIYKYDPVTTEKNILFTGNTTIDAIRVSSDGSLLFFSGAEGLSSYIRFLRVIATANPAQSTTLFEFDYNQRLDRYLASWTLDPDTRTAYLAGASVNMTEPAEDIGEFVKVSVDNNLECTWTTLVAPDVNWSDPTGLDIRHGISHLTVNADGSVWCISGVGNNWYGTTRLYNELFCWIVDRSGKLMDPTDEPSFIPQVFLDEEKIAAHRIDLAQSRGDWLYYIANTVTDRENSQTRNDQKLYRFNMRSEAAIENLFVNVSQSADITINSFDITENYAYFSGFHGDSYLAGKIDLNNSLAYEPLDFERKVTAIISY